jgi:hypothetical protein
MKNITNRNKEIKEFFSMGISKKTIENFFYKAGRELTKKEKIYLTGLK